MRIACIGSRQTPPFLLTWMERAGAELVRGGHVIVTGNAVGADQAWARGGNTVDSTKVELCLPWASFELHAVKPGNVVRVYDRERDVQYTDRASITHDNWRILSPAIKKIHARNAMIVMDAARVFSYTRKRSTSGTKFGLAIAHALKIPIHDVSDQTIREAIEGGFLP